MTWIFGYGSLVSPTSLASTIGRTLSIGSGMHIAELADYRRAWNYGSEVLRGDWVDEAGRRTTGGLVVSLGIVGAPGDSINGVVFAVNDDGTNTIGTKAPLGFAAPTGKLSTRHSLIWVRATPSGTAARRHQTFQWSTSR